MTGKDTEIWLQDRYRTNHLWLLFFKFYRKRLGVEIAEVKPFVKRPQTR